MKSILASLLRSTALLAAFSLPAASLTAEEASIFSVRGFGTLGMVRTNTDAVGFVRDLYQPDGATNDWTAKTDSVLGVQVNALLSPELEAVVQAVSRHKKGGSFSPEIAWAYLKYEPTPAWTFRLGRVGTDFFMLSDSRLVGYSYLTVRPPVDFFTHLPFYSIDGGDVAYTVSEGEDVFRFKIFAGNSREKLGLEDETWRLNGSTMTGVSAGWSRGPWQLRASYSDILFHQNLPLRNLMMAAIGSPPFVPPIVTDAENLLSVDGTRARYYSFGAVFEQGNWQIQAMANHIRQDSRFFKDTDSGYLLGGYRLGEVTPYVGVSRVVSHARESSGNTPAAALADAFADQSIANQTTWTLGARWDVMSNVALKGQVDVVRSRPEALFPYRDDTSRWDGKLRVFSLSMDFLF